MVFANTVVMNASRGRMYDNTDTVPYNYVGLLLGTSPYMRDGSENPFFASRVRAAADLYAAGRIDLILASGDNLYRTYNEPARMRAALIEGGIPEDRIIVDAAGYRTLDSVIRAGTVFGWERFTIISQEFHNHRAVFVARESDLDAVAFNAADVGGYTGLRQSFREHLARTLAVLDLHVLGTEPREKRRVDMSM